MFASAAVFQTLDALHEESIIGAGGISRLLGFVGRTVTEQMADEQEREDRWYVNHGELMASLIAQDPEAVSREQLAGYCDLFDIDYIMLFDPEGKEIACSADYIGFTLDSGLGKDSRDFRRLLLGIPSIVHGVSRDPVTELERKYIGVRLPFDTGSGEPAYGALIMALLPDKTSIEDIDIIGQFHFVDKENRSYFYTDQESGEILYSSDRSLVGKTVMDCGLPERSLQDGYTDFALFNKVNSYVTMIKQETVDFFYVIRSTALFSSTLPLAIASLACYLVTLLILGCFGRKEYTAEAYDALLGSQMQQGNDDLSAAFDGYDFMPLSDFSELMVSKNRSDIILSMPMTRGQAENVWQQFAVQLHHERKLDARCEPVFLLCDRDRCDDRDLCACAFQRYFIDDRRVYGKSGRDDVPAALQSFELSGDPEHSLLCIRIYRIVHEQLYRIHKRCIPGFVDRCPGDGRGYPGRGPDPV